jgi:lysophospholipase L1-like esterase
MGGESTPSAAPANAPQHASRRGVRIGCGLVVVLLVLYLGLEGLLRGLGWHFTRKFDAQQKHAMARRDCVTILALGESTTGGSWVDPGQPYPAQLERILTRKYHRPICVVFPMHYGQNSSQMLNRIDRYLDSHSPRLVVLMCGVNNTWSLEESNIWRFVNVFDVRQPGLLLRIVLDRSRVFKLARMTLHDLNWRIQAASEIEGTPPFTPWPPPDENVRFGSANRAAFLRMWRYEIGEMIDRSRAHGAEVVLMTYPNYDFPPISEFEALAARKGIPLQRNDLLMKPLLDPAVVEHYFFLEGHHPKAEGYGIIASELAHLIEERDLLHLRGTPARR